MSSDAWFVLFAFVVMITAGILIFRNNIPWNAPGVGEPFKSEEEERKEKDDWDKKYGEKFGKRSK